MFEHCVFQEMYCEMCGKNFRKATDFSMHKQAHILEQQNARIRNYQCSECKQPMRSRNQLNRHMETVHGNVERRKSEMNDSDAGMSSSLCTDDRVLLRNETPFVLGT